MHRLDFFSPPGLSDDLEAVRKVRLVASFSFLGGIFGCLYAGFYLAIGHDWGAAVIAACTLAFLTVPWAQRRWGSAPAANFLCFILILGFVTLCSIEGGLHGHAIAWLVSIPLCALLLAGERPALIWCLLSLLAASIFIGLDASGVAVPLLYAAKWETLVTGAGYLGLIVFMFVLGLIFERGRNRANRAMRAALGELAEANADLQRLNREKNEFLGIAAHDLKNPLSSVAGYAELLHGRMASSPEDVADCSGRILDASQQMIELITNLLDVNAIEEGKLLLDVQRCDLAGIVGGVVAAYLPAAEKKRIPLQWAPPSPSPAIRADPRATRQILDNLVSNAVKYSPVGGAAIVVRVIETGTHWAIEVEDAGPGLSAEDQTRLFGKFARLSARPTGGESSTGLGLSIVRRMATEMGGEVACRSALGAGSVFTASLPKWAD